MMLWLYDSAGTMLSAIAEWDSIVTTERYREHSEWTGKFPASAYTALGAAYFAIVADEPEVYLVEQLELVTEGMRTYVTASGRSASALLHLRTIITQQDWSAMTAGAMISDMMADLTGARALPLVFGTGLAVGTTFSLQQVWGDMGAVALEILAAQYLGMRTRLDGAAVKIDVFAANNVDTVHGEAYGNGEGSKYATNSAEWRNYAYVLGEGVGTARIQEVVDQTSGGERRELYVDARDLDQGVLPEADYKLLLAARGAAKLADTRKLEYGEAQTTAALRAGDVIWYDSTLWSASFMVTEAVTIREGGTVRHSATLGEPPATLRKTIRRYF